MPRCKLGLDFVSWFELCHLHRNCFFLWFCPTETMRMPVLTILLLLPIAVTASPTFPNLWTNTVTNSRLNSYALPIKYFPPPRSGFLQETHSEMVNTTVDQRQSNGAEYRCRRWTPRLNKYSSISSPIPGSYMRSSCDTCYYLLFFHVCIMTLCFFLDHDILELFLDSFYNSINL